MHGKIIQIIGPVVDIAFEDKVPPLYQALEIVGKKDTRLVFEVAAHLGGGVVRAVSMGPTEGLRRGEEVRDTGAPISVPVGKEVLGRMFNLLGEPIDGLGEVKGASLSPIHRKAPLFKDQKTEVEIFETGIKVIDLIAPFIKGGKVGLFGGAGVGKTVLLQELIRDELGSDVLLFIDNIFRFTQAGSEVSALLGRMPSAVGYQPTLASEMG